MTHPKDKLLFQDAVIIGLFLVLGMFLVSSIHFRMTGTPAEDCANVLNSAISPYQVHQLTGADFPELPWRELVQWCSENPITWERQIEIARDYPEFPHHLDMF